eukprot:TRINITY_DN3993_c0_g1_i1.p1 TRINITY_DN3993_c0_g1~~TRINITY_DN3993_c0_g1_i1.p1  ORF type:complete len:439 (-),score=77.58 TRINITY_DN3993_c0_g1_i1:180-1496(-)
MAPLMTSAVTSMPFTDPLITSVVPSETNVSSTTSDNLTKLFLVHNESQRIHVYSQVRAGEWQMTRIPQIQAGKSAKILMTRGSNGWQITEGNVKIVSRTPLSKQDCLYPPLGLWKSVDREKRGGAWHGEWTLCDSRPEVPPLKLPRSLDTSFLSLSCRLLEETRTAQMVMVNIDFHRSRIEDQQLEDVFAAMKEVIEDMAARPEVSLQMRVSLEDMPIPSMRHVKRLISFAGEVGDLLFLLGRGNAIVFKSSGFWGGALVNVIRLLQAASPPPWPEVIVSSKEEADAFLEEIRAACPKDLAEESVPPQPTSLNADIAPTPTLQMNEEDGRDSKDSENVDVDTSEALRLPWYRSKSNGSQRAFNVEVSVQEVQDTRKQASLEQEILQPFSFWNCCLYPQRNLDQEWTEEFPCTEPGAYQSQRWRDEQKAELLLPPLLHL